MYIHVYLRAHTYTYVHIYIYCDALRPLGQIGDALPKSHCNTRQHTLQHTATYCNALQHVQHTATHCNTLQTLQHTETHTSPSWVGRSGSFPIQTSAETGKEEGFTTIAIKRGLFLILRIFSSGCPFSSTKVHTMWWSSSLHTTGSCKKIFLSPTYKKTTDLRSYTDSRRI